MSVQRKALVVGIDNYEHVGSLHGCEGDAYRMQSVLERHADGSVNFQTRTLVDSVLGTPITRDVLLDNVKELFSGDEEVVLFYFAGHGSIESTGGYLVTAEAKRGESGLGLDEVFRLANQCKARSRIIILDSCHAGVAGKVAAGHSELQEGLTILAASSETQYANEVDGSGVFTTLLVDALNGGAANLLGQVTPGSAYAHIDQALGAWAQRPIFKTNVKSFVSLRNVQPPLPPPELRRICEFFPQKGFVFPLDPSFEPERAPGTAADVPPPDPENTAIFAILQRYNRVNLVVPVDADHMWHAAMGSKAVRLTGLGEHYRDLAAKRLI